MYTAVDRGYAALGWNHPGFAASSGFPYDATEMEAVDAVYHYAIDKLGYASEDIIAFGWSIGGFPASYLAREYPTIGGLIIDASFAHLTQIAAALLPANICTPVIICIFSLKLISPTFRQHSSVSFVGLL